MRSAKDILHIFTNQQYKFFGYYNFTNFKLFEIYCNQAILSGVMKLRLASEGAKQGFEIGRFVNIFYEKDDGKYALVCVFRYRSGEWTPTDPLKALQFLSPRRYRVVLEALNKQGPRREIDSTIEILEIPPET